MRFSPLLLLSTISFAWAKVVPESPVITPAPVLRVEDVDFSKREDKMDLSVPLLPGGGVHAMTDLSPVPRSQRF